MPRKQKKYHYLYKTTNLINGKFYVGMHSTDEIEDGYLGSGKYLRRSIIKHGKENFKREILMFFENRKELILNEEGFVTEKFLTDPLCMNLRTGGAGTSIGTERSEDIKKKMSEISSRTFVEKVGEKKAKEWAKKVSDSLNKYYEQNEISPELRKKMSDSHKGQIAWNKGKKTGLSPWNKGKIGVMKNTGCGSKKGSVPWNRGMKTNICWIFNETIKESKSIIFSELDNWLSLGWKKGRKIKW